MFYFSIKNASPRWAESRSPKPRVRDDNLWSDHGRIVVELSLYWRK